jgi:sec-independent protein translocase protein TatA
MGAFSIWHLGLLAFITLLLFGGGGKLSRIMGDVGKGITSFKEGLRESNKHAADAAPDSVTIVHPTGGKVIEGNAMRQDDMVRR